MLNETNRRERSKQARQRLNELHEQGYRYLVTHDDGDSWVGCMSDGIEIELLLSGEFIGNVVVPEGV